MDDGNVTAGELVDFAAKASGIDPVHIQDCVLIIHAHEITPGKCSTRVAMSHDAVTAIETAEAGVEVLVDEYHVQHTIEELERTSDFSSLTDD